ncbi:MAG: pilus assembly protein TadB, partial [Actinomycetota bacterium]|nr:pilus assembly protein TadB [Actinomycetota bacterium]
FGPALAEAGLLAGRGDAPEAALAGEPALAPLAVACGLVNRTGASFADLLAGVRVELSTDRSTRRSVQAAVSGPRSSAMLLAVLPVVGLAMGAAMGADPGRVLLRTPVGLVALTIGVLLDLSGVLWTLLLTRPRQC